MAEERRRKITEEDRSKRVTNPSTCNSDQICKMDESETYEVGGGKLSLHGMSYQRKLLMLFALRSIVRHKKFKLATEMKKADKVDDVILIYPKVNGVGNIFRFLQAKHRIGIAKDMRKISATDLLKESKDDFSIPTYFQAYLNIVDNWEFLEEGDEILDLIICSNTGFWFGSSYEDFILKDDMFEDIDEEDFIFGKTLRKFKQEFSGRKKIVLSLMNCFSKLPRNFAKNTSISKTYDHPKNVNSIEKQLELECLYEIVFLEEVVDLKTKTFREDFVVGVNLSGIGKHFRGSLISEWEILNDKGGFEKWLKGKLVDVNGITEDHGLKVKSVAKKLSESVRKSLSSTVINICDEKSVLYKMIDKLKFFSVLEVTERGFRFSKQFLCSDGLCDTANRFRKEFFNNLSYFKIDCNTLEDIKFELDDELIQSKSLTISDFKPEHYVEQFLTKLVFALDQPNEEELGIIVKGELKSLLVGCDVETGYSKLYRWIDEWMSSPKGKYLTEDDFKSFINDLKEEVFFDLRDPVSNFTGRSKELNELHVALFQSESKTACISQTATISGLGGIGKSELARMYAKVHRKEFNNIIWIDSETRETMEFSFRRLAYDRLNISRKNSNGDDKRIESIVEEVYQRLEGKRNLFVFDNAEQLRSVGEGSNGIQKYISPSSEGNWNYYIITSRNRKWGAMKVVDIDKFTDDEAMEFFRISFGDLDYFDSEELMKLSDALGNFPLAMQQAVAYIKETSDQLRIFNKHFTVSDYLKLFHAKSKELLQHEFPSYCDDNYTRTTYTTMKIAIESISSKEHGSLSVRILNIISYLYSEEIESSLVLRLLNTENVLSLSKALHLLHQYSMISLEGSTSRVHRLLQLVTRNTLKEQGFEKEVLENILEFLKPSELTHSMSVWEYASEYKELVKKYVEFSKNLLVILFYTVGGPALFFGLKLESTLREVFGYFHSHTCYVRLQVGVAIAFYDGATAANVIQKNFEGQREFLGEFHPDTLYSQLFHLGFSIRGNDNIDSVAISKDLLEKSKVVYGDGSYFTIAVKSELALSLYNSLNYEESLRLYEEVTREIIQSSSHSLDFILCRVELMIPIIKIESHEDYFVSYEMFGRKFDEILRKTDLFLLRSCLSVFTELVCVLFREYILKTFNLYHHRFTERYGEENLTLSIWKMLYGKALLLSDLADSALKVLLEVYDIQKRLTYEEHITVIETKFCIANAYCRKVNHRESLRIHEWILGVFEKCYREHPPRIIHVKREIGKDYAHLGKYDLALEILEEVHEREKSYCKLSNKYNVNVSVEYAEVLEDIGLFDKSALKFGEIYEFICERLGERNICTLQICLKYSRALYNSGDRMKSLQLLNRVRHVFNEMDIQADNSVFLKFYQCLASVLSNFNMTREERTCLLKILRLQEKLIGRNHLRTLYTICGLAKVEFDLGHVQNARELLKEVESNLSSDESTEDEYAGLKIMLANMFLVLNDLNKALKFMKEVQEIQDKNLNLNQNEINSLMCNIALNMSEQGDFDQCLSILRDVISKQTLTLGPEHRKTLRTQLLVTSVLSKKGNIKAAIKLCKKVELKQNISFGEDDIDSLRTKLILAELVAMTGNIQKAISSVRLCHGRMCEKYGEDDIDTLSARFTLGCMLCVIGELEQGKKCLFEVYKKQKELLGENHVRTVETKNFLNALLRM